MRARLVYTKVLLQHCFGLGNRLWTVRHSAPVEGRAKSAMDKGTRGSEAGPAPERPQAAGALGYQHVVEVLSERIRVEYRPGQRLKPERALAEEFGVNRHTVRRALLELERAGAIATLRGSGSVVVNRRLSHRVTLQTRFTASAAAAGIAPRTTVLAATNQPPDDAAAECVRLHGRRPDGMIVTLRHADGTPVCWIRHLFAGIDAEAVARGFPGGSLHAHLAERHGVVLERRSSRVFADRPVTADLRHLNISRDQPMLCASSVNVSPGGGVWEVSLTRFRGDAVDLEFAV